MLGPDSVVALIPARAGSKGIPGKNLAAIGGRSLLAWAVLVARSVPAIDRVIVSSDGEAILAAAREAGAETIERPASLATDTAGVHAVVLDMRDRLRREGRPGDIAVVLEPTSPFRSARMIEDCLAVIAAGHDSVATFTECRTHPHRAWTLTGPEPQTFIAGANPWVRRQSLSPAHEITGEVYAFRLDMVREDSESLLVGRPGAVVVSADSSMDINSPMELELARLMFPDSVLARLDADRAPLPVAGA